MGLSVLIDDFTGDPQDFYNLVVEEINRREIAGIEYSWVQEGESAKLFGLSGAVDALRVSFRGESIRILGYQIGRCFHASARVFHVPEEKSNTRYLHAVAMACFEEVVNRATRTALQRHLEARSAPVPGELALRSVFLLQKH